jgi:hypothetical protein
MDETAQRRHVLVYGSQYLANGRLIGNIRLDDDDLGAGSLEVIHLPAGRIR